MQVHQPYRLTENRSKDNCCSQSRTLTHLQGAYSISGSGVFSATAAARIGPPSRQLHLLPRATVRDPTILALVSQNFKRSRHPKRIPYCRNLTGVFSLQTKFEMSSFIRSNDVAWAQKRRNGLHDPNQAHLGNSQLSQG